MDRAYTLSTIASVAIVCALVLMMSDLSRPQLWPLAGCYAIWSASPALVPYLVAQRRDNDGYSSLMFAMSSVATVIAIAGYVFAIATKGKVAGLMFLFMPFGLWIAILLVLGLRSVAGRLARRIVL